MAKQAAGILLYRRGRAGLEVLLAHPGGPLWARKDAGAWTLPKGQFTDSELPLDAAKREFEEEMGSAPSGEFHPLGTIRQPSGKVIHAWAAESDFDVRTVKSNLFELEWPPKTGLMAEFPEIDRAGWFSIAEAGLSFVLRYLFFVLAVAIATAPSVPHADSAGAFLRASCRASAALHHSSLSAGGWQRRRGSSGSRGRLRRGARRAPGCIRPCRCCRCGLRW